MNIITIVMFLPAVVTFILPVLLWSLSFLSIYSHYCYYYHYFYDNYYHYHYCCNYHNYHYRYSSWINPYVLLKFRPVEFWTHTGMYWKIWLFRMNRDEAFENVENWATFHLNLLKMKNHITWKQIAVTFFSDKDWRFPTKLTLLEKVDNRPLISPPLSSSSSWSSSSPSLFLFIWRKQKNIK